LPKMALSPLANPLLYQF